MKKLNIRQATADPCLYIRGRSSDAVYIIVHVDDFLIVGKTIHIEKAKQQIGEAFETKDLGRVKSFLGMDVIRTNQEIWLGQTGYIKTILQKYGMSDSNPRISPLNANQQLTSEGQALTDDTPYRGIVGSLLYLSTCTRPDITHATGMLSRYMMSPTNEHWEAAKAVLRYLRGTADLGLMFSKNSSGVHGYTDSDFAGDIISRRSTSGMIFLKNGTPVVWASKLQIPVTTSTCEAELIACCSAVKEALHLSKLMTDIDGTWKALVVQ